MGYKDPFTLSLIARDQRIAEQSKRDRQAERYRQRTIKGCHNCKLRKTCELSVLKRSDYYKGIIYPMPCQGELYEADPRKTQAPPKREKDLMFENDLPRTFDE